MEELFDIDALKLEPQITGEYILSQVDDSLIYSRYLGTAFKIGTRMRSPFRRDENPSFSITFNPHWLKLMWKDFGTGEVGDCFKLIAKLRGITYNEAVDLVACDLGMKDGCISVFNKEELSKAKQYKETFKKREYLIQIEPRKFTEKELDYWDQYNISKRDLLDNQIFSIGKIWINKNIIYLDKGPNFGYYFPDEDKWKIYSPYNPDYKWFGNVSSIKMEYNEEKYDKNLPIIITKSRKDRIILSKLYQNVASCQNENEYAIPKEFDKVLEKYPAKYCWFDSDDPGKEANKKLNRRGYKWINTPNELYEQYELKDPGDVIRHFGWEEGSQILSKEIDRKLKV